MAEQMQMVKENEGALEGGKFLGFILGKETFGIELLKTQEILGIIDITKVPYTPACIKGVVNLRGKVIPVMDLRIKFGLPPMDYGKRTCIIVVNINVSVQDITLGIIVDEVSEVFEIAADSIEKAPGIQNEENADLILGLGKVGNKVTVLLDVNEILSKNMALDLLKIPNNQN